MWSLLCRWYADGQVSQDAAVQVMEKCIEDIRTWMINDRLLHVLKGDKTEVILIGNQY